jgi:hypothetical protein
MKRFKIILIILLILVAVGFGYSIISPWSEFNCQHDDIDILTARRRCQRYVLFIKLSEKIEETDISKRWKKHFGKYPEPDWRRVNTFPGFGRIVSPHYAFHGALAAATMLEKGFQLASFSENAEKKAIRVFLQLLQREKDYHSAGRYCNSIMSEAIDTKESEVIEDDKIPSFDEWIEKHRERKP